MILVDLEGVSASRPGKPLFDNLSLTVSTGDRLGVVGLNGSGKSTLLRVLAGAAEPETGQRRVGKGVRVAFLDQVPDLGTGTVAEVVGAGWEADAVLDRLGMTPLRDADVGTLSGGQVKRVALARALLAGADLLILDEPTNHLDIETINWLEDQLAAFRGGLVLVTHDRHVLDRVTTRIVEVDRGATYTYTDGYAGYLLGRAEREEQAAVSEAVRRNLAKAELAWLRRGAPARSRKPKARIAAATAIVEGRPQAAARDGELALGFGAARLGDKGIELTGVGFHHPGAPVLFEGLDLTVDRGTRLGIVGPNGVGKSTLLDLLAGRKEPTAGSIERGVTVRVGYHDQVGVELDLDQRVRDAVAGPTRVASWQEDRLLEQFWFGADARHAPIRLLSGGERRRLQLLLVLAERPNVLLLDEPTNDLDLDTLRSLEDFLEDWSGALVVVSHDRAFLERTVEEVLAFDGHGGVAMVPGGYSAWEASRTGRRPEALQGRSADSAASRRPGAHSPTRSATPSGPSPSTIRERLKRIEKELAALQRRRVQLEKELVAAGGDHVALARLGTELAEVQQDIDRVEDRWLELSVGT
ncbi:MAG TPA: ABC-F family ATP-binding cassette domain-containing protein [Acidimicrobiales bacterium]|nr:ABC-F family ATP-binding cassette domain-containing protein [Acidimicrobiales bacterium]